MATLNIGVQPSPGFAQDAPCPAVAKSHRLQYCTATAEFTKKRVLIVNCYH